MATIYYADGSVEEITLPGSLKGCLARLQGIVGGPIEMVALPDAIVVVNEEGKLRGLPFNAHATTMCRKHLWSWDWGIVGNAVVGTIEEMDPPE